MILRCAVLLFCLHFVRTLDVTYSGTNRDVVSEVDERFSLWPSFHNGLLMRIRKREVEGPKPALETKLDSQPGGQVIAAPSEGSPGETRVIAPEEAHVQAPVNKPADKLTEKPVEKPLDKPVDTPTAAPPQQAVQPEKSPSITQAPPPATNEKKDDKTPKPEDQVPGNNTAVNAVPPANATEKKVEVNTTATATDTAPKINLSDPGVVKRALIVFGGFALLGTAYYFIFYRKRNSMNEAKNSHGSIDPNQFRYGVLQSEEKRNNLELSRVPLTMESDEDDDDDLEIFDLGQKKKSLSYINLEQHDDDIVLNDSRSIDMENLLVDIEDKNSDALINWSGNGSKSIL